MKSIIQEALSRIGINENTDIMVQDTETDAELRDLVAKLKTHIKIIGCGGAGSNTINRIVEEGIGGAELIACNTDAQHLLHINAPRKILLGRKGYGAGAIPQIGEEAAREVEDKLRAALSDADIVFITAGMGGGTGTGAAPVVAKIAKDLGALTVAFVTIPFRGEGTLRMENALWGIDKLRDVADTVVVIPNDKLLQLVPRLPVKQAFKVSDEVLMRAMKGLTESLTKPGLVNIDFNDIKTIMCNAGVALIGFGESNAEGEERALEALDLAINSPLLDVDIRGATGVLVNVIGGPDMTLAEAERVAEEVHNVANPTARIIWGATVDPELEGHMRVMLIVTGIRSNQIFGRRLPSEIRREFDVDFVR